MKQHSPTFLEQQILEVPLDSNFHNPKFLIETTKNIQL